MKTREERNEYAKKWYAANRERLLEKERNRIKTPEQKKIHYIAAKKYYIKNKEKVDEKARTWKREHRASIRKYYSRSYEGRKPYQQQNADSIRESRKLYRENNKELITSQKKAYYNANKEKIKAKDKLKYQKRKPLIQQHNKENRLIINKRHREYIAERSKDPLFKLRRYIPKLIRISINRYGYSKKSKTYSILGCTWNELKIHFESKFEPWMNWDNRSKYNGELNYGWDIDHIIPVSSAKTEEEMMKLNHYTNLQPLDGFINRYVKSGKVS